jgi:hypothetical protein
MVLQEYLTAKEVQAILRCGRTKAYEVVREINSQQAYKGRSTIAGRVKLAAFEEVYGIVEKFHNV